MGTPPSLPGCAQVISEATARGVFDAVRAQRPGDGCVLEGVQTEGQQMRIRWSKDGRAIEPVVLLPASCAPASATKGRILSLVAPPEASSACPDAVAAVRALVQKEDFGGPLDTIELPAPALEAVGAPWRLATALAVGPLLAGLVLGLVVRRARRRPLPRWLSPVLVAGIPTASILIATPRYRLGLWDVASAGLLFALGLVGAAGVPWLERRRPQALLAAVALALSLGGAELVLHRAVQRPYLIPPIEDDRLIVPRANLLDLDEGVASDSLFLTHRGHLDQCGYLHPELFAQHVDRYMAAPPDKKKVVLHLGDSMTVGGGVERRQAFPAVLERLLPETAQLNAGAQGMTADFYFLVGKAWVERMERKPDLVVVNLFTGNDVDDMDQPMVCCHDGPLLEYGPGGAVARCPEVSWPLGEGESLGWFYRHSPPPYPLLYAAHHSDLAAWATVWLLDFRRAGLPYKPDREVQWAHLEAAIKALRDEMARRKIPLVAVILPLRQALEAPDPAATVGYATARRMKEICDGLGVAALEPWDRFAALTKAEGAEALFLPPGDVHFTAHGHELLAAWLRDPLGRVLDGGSAAAAP